MRSTRLVTCVAAAVAVSAATAPASFAAVPCGTTPSGSTEPAVGALAIDATAADDPTLDGFKGSTESRKVRFIFKVTGCRLTQDSDVRVRPAVDNPDDSDEALQLKAPEPKGNLLIVDGKVYPERFHPGTKKLTMVASSPSNQVESLSVKVTMKRQEPFWWKVLLMSLVALAGGLFCAYELARQAAVDAYDEKKAAAEKAKPKKEGFMQKLTHRKHAERKIRYGGFKPLLGVAVGAGGAFAAALQTGYFKVDDWSPAFPEWVILVFALGAAVAGGAAAGFAKLVTAAELPEPAPPQ